MKIYSLILATAILGNSHNSCKKDQGDPLTKTQILTNNTWQVEEDYNSHGGIIYYYNRSGKTNFPSPGLAAIRYTFNSDHTGTYTDGYGDTHKIDWSFSSGDETNMKVTFHFGTSMPTHEWRMVSITQKMFLTTAYVPDQDLLVSVKLIPVQ